MDASSPERSVLRTILLDAGIAGAVLGAFSLAGGSLVLYERSGLLVATAGLVASLLLALLVGLWVAAPGTGDDDPPVRERWLVASLSVAIAGVFASLLQVNEALASGVVGRVGTLLLLVAMPAYTLGLALPALFTRGQRRYEYETGEPADAEVVGRLVCGLLGGAALGAVVAGFLMVRGVGPGPILLGSSLLLLAPLLLQRQAVPQATEELIYEADTPFHALRITEVIHPGDRQPERRLYLNGEEESGELVRSGAPTLAYIAAGEAWLAERPPRGGSYLFLGGGAYTLPRRVAERDSRATITVVELDPEVTATAYRFFGMRPHHGIRSVHGDARAYLESGQPAEYDRIYADVYGGNESLPYALVTVEALEALRERLRSGGAVAFNVIGTTHGAESTRFWSVVRTFAAVFPSVELYVHLGRDYPDRQNLLLAGAAEVAYEFPSRAGLFERWPAEEWPEIAEAMVYRDLLGPPMRSDSASGAYALLKGEQ